MALKFKIEYIQESNPVMVIARQLQKGDFSIGANSTLGGCRLREYLSQPRAIKQEGTQDPDVFVFCLADETDRQKLSIGDAAELIP